MFLRACVRGRLLVCVMTVSLVLLSAFRVAGIASFASVANGSSSGPAPGGAGRGGPAITFDGK